MSKYVIAASCRGDIMPIVIDAENELDCLVKYLTRKNEDGEMDIESSVDRILMFVKGHDFNISKPEKID